MHNIGRLASRKSWVEAISISPAVCVKWTSLPLVVVAKGIHSKGQHHWSSIVCQIAEAPRMFSLPAIAIGVKMTWSSSARYANEGRDGYSKCEMELRLESESNPPEKVKKDEICKISA